MFTAAMIMVLRVLWSIAYPLGTTGMVSHSLIFFVFSLEAIGIAQKIFYSKETRGLFKPSKILVFVDVVVLGFRVV